MKLLLVCITLLVLTASPSVGQKKFKKLIWSDEFNGIGMPDTTKWVYDIGTGGENGWGNNELQYYTNEAQNVRVENGSLIIEAIKQQREGKQYTSARIKSKGKGDWLYGRFEIKAQLPNGVGTWPAIWLLPTTNVYGGWPGSGEIDIMEHVGYDHGVIHGTIHTEKYNHGKNTQIGATVQIADADKSFHRYALEWEENALRFYVDDRLYQTVKRNPREDYKGWPFDQPFHIIMNLAVGGNWGGANGVDDSIWPQKMLIEYVRIYQ
jgi:beta-glucanase (GH16 family)